MKRDLLNILRCPFCGGRLQLEKDPLFEVSPGEIDTGILYCECCAFPVVAGIPYLRCGTVAKSALGMLHQQKAEHALGALLGLDPERATEFRRRLSKPLGLSFQQALRLLSPTAEGCYFLYRFSDPTFLVSEAILRSVVNEVRNTPGWVLDLGGGTGHLTRILARLCEGRPVVLADLEFWKLWLAKQFVAPEAQAVCCDANFPLPFGAGCFALAFSSDALNYIWQKRLAVGEMMRLLGTGGTLLVTHMHNACCENFSAGMPLSPGGYRWLFAEAPAKLFKESMILQAFLEKRGLDLSRGYTDEELHTEPSLFALVSHEAQIFKPYPAGSYVPARSTAINPLYQCEHDGSRQIWKLRFPDTDYETEFANCKLYLPDQFELNVDQRKRLETGELDVTLEDLVRRRALLDLPPSYLQA